jgi:subtilisin family serine protease
MLAPRGEKTMVTARKSSVLITSSCLLLAFTVCPPIWAQIRFEVEMNPEFDSGKLSPDLYVARYAGATFLGITPDGAAVLEFEADLDEDAIIRTLANVRGVRRAEVHGGQPFEEIVQAVIGHLPRDPDYQPRDTFDGLDGLVIVDPFPEDNFVVVQSTDGFSSGELAAVEDSNNSVYIEPNFTYHLTRTPNDPKYKDQWGMKIGTPSTNAPIAWDKVTNSNVIVAVVDTGVKYNHLDLATNMWINIEEQQGQTGHDDNNPQNGYVDDIHGIDLVNNSGDPMDISGHGTHCAGTIGAVGHNKYSITGVCWKVQIMAIRAFRDANSTATAATLAEAIRYAVNNGAQVINCSWGGGKKHEAIESAINFAHSQGRLVVCAAGNNHRDTDNAGFYPASYPMPNIISV